MSNITEYPINDFSLGVQGATSWQLKKPNELNRGINLNFSKVVGAVTRKDGNQISGSQFSSINPAATGAHVAKYTTGSVRFIAVNNDTNTNVIIRTQNISTGVWTTLSGISYPVNTIVFFLDYLDEVYISGFDPTTGNPVQPYNVDNTLNVSSTRNIQYMPWPYFIVEYLGVLYACNVLIGANRYPDRFYKASAPLGYMTTVQGAQTDVYTSVVLTDNVPTMTGYTTPSGVAAASSEVNAANQAWQAFDDVPGPPTTPGGSRWISSTTSGWVRYDFGAASPRIITYYSIVGEYSGETVGRGPKTWTFEGSNDASSWTVLDARTNVATWNQSIAEKRTYAVNNTTPYRYYRLNISANQGADYVAVEELELLTSTAASKTLQLKVDSVRYVKVGQLIDIYRAGTDTFLFTIQVLTVDKSNNIVTFTPYTNQFAAASVSTTADTITLTGLGSQYPTGTPIRFQTNNTLPAPLITDTTYYAIYVDANTIKVATSTANAQTGNAIDLTSQGTGPHYVLYSYALNDNDELWLNGRKGKNTVFWNVDYPTPQATGEWFALKPGVDSANIITGASKSSNRLFVWGKNSGTRWDGSNLVVFNNSTGCVSHRSIGNIDDDWIIWLDAKAQVWARNESSSQQELISKPVKYWLNQMTQDQLKAANCVISANTYKLNIGIINGQNIRLVYDFDGNTWSVERLVKPQLIGAGTDDSTGILRPVFAADDGYMYVDEIGNYDGTKAIPFEMGTGRDMLGTSRKKKFYGVKIFSSNASGLKVEAAVDGGQFKEQGEIEGKVCFIPFSERGDNRLRSGVTIDLQIVASIEGDAPIIESYILYFISQEDVPSVQQH